MNEATHFAKSDFTNEIYFLQLDNSLDKQKDFFLNAKSNMLLFY